MPNTLILNIKKSRHKAATRLGEEVLIKSLGSISNSYDSIFDTYFLNFNNFIFISSKRCNFQKTTKKSFEFAKIKI